MIYRKKSAKHFNFIIQIAYHHFTVSNKRALVACFFPKLRRHMVQAVINIKNPK